MVMFQARRGGVRFAAPTTLITRKVFGSWCFAGRALVGPAFFSRFPEGRKNNYISSVPVWYALPLSRCAVLVRGI